VLLAAWVLANTAPYGGDPKYPFHTGLPWTYAVWDRDHHLLSFDPLALLLDLGVLAVLVPVAKACARSRGP
jgi:hypothetical protein